MKTPPSLAAFALLLVPPFSSLSKSGESAATAARAPESAAEGSGAWTWKDLWDLPVLYENPDNPYIQEVALTNRYQYQYAAVDSDQGDWDRGETRRWRAGAKIKFLEGFELSGDININDDFEPFYNSLEELHLTWNASNLFHLRVGKQKPLFTYEWSTSSRLILTFERSLLVNQVLPQKSTGASIYGTYENWSYLLGGYSAGWDEEFGRTDKGSFFLGSIGYDLSDLCSCVDSFKWRLDFLHNEGDSDATGPKPYNETLSTSLVAAKGKFGLVSDFIAAWGDSPDVFGVVLLGNFDITEKLQLVCRYHYAGSSDDGLRAQSRYEREVDINDGGRGDEYHSIYLGLNYYLNEHKLKLMTGVEYANMNDKEGDGGDFDGFTWFAGLRLYY